MASPVGVVFVHRSWKMWLDSQYNYVSVAPPSVPLRPIILFVAH